MTTFLDTSVVISLLDEGHVHHIWSTREFAKCKEVGPAVISDIVYCEISVGMMRRSDLDQVVEMLGLERLPCNDDALFRAGKAFREYKETNKGQKLGVLPDFLIGAAAEVHDAPLMTANSRDFVRYFPRIKVISPLEKESR